MFGRWIWKQTYSVKLHANIILHSEAQTSEQRRQHSNSVGRACDLSSTSRQPWFLSQKLNALHYPLPETEIHTLHPNVCRYHPCLWSQVQLVRLMPSTDAEFSQIIVSTSLKFSSRSYTQFETFNGSTSVTQATGPEGVECRTALQLRCERIWTLR